MTSEVKKILIECVDIINSFLRDENSIKTIDLASEILARTLERGGKAISCGNGGSMCDAMHFAEEFTARFKTNRPSLAALAISDPAYISCAANDFGYDYVFSRFIEGIGKEDDCLIAISTSGNSKNVIKAVETAKKKKIYTIGLLGKGGGKLLGICDLTILIPSDKTERVQEMHIKVIHLLIELTEDILKKKHYLL